MRLCERRKLPINDIHSIYEVISDTQSHASDDGMNQNSASWFTSNDEVLRIPGSNSPRGRPNITVSPHFNCRVLTTNRLEETGRNKCVKPVSTFEESRITWLRTIDEDVQPHQNIGVHSAWRKVKNMDTWRQVASTAIRTCSRFLCLLFSVFSEFWISLLFFISYLFSFFYFSCLYFSHFLNFAIFTFNTISFLSISLFIFSYVSVLLSLCARLNWQFVCQFLNANSPLYFIVLYRAGPTMKLRRGVVLKMYQNTIDTFYASDTRK